MSRWRSKKALRRMLAACLLVLAAAGVFWTQLPGMVERRVRAQLTAAGFMEARLRVTTVGFRRLEFADLSLGTSRWSMRSRKGTVRYHPLGLLRSDLESLRLDELEVIVDLQTEGTPATAVGFGSWSQAVKGASAALPLRSVSVSNGVLRLHQGARRAAIPFWVVLTNDRPAQHFRVDVQAQGPAERLRLQGELDPRSGARATAEFTFTNAIPWLALVLPDDLATWLEASHLSPLEGALDLHAPAGQEHADMSGSLRPFQVRTSEARLATGPTTFRGRLGRDGAEDLRMATAVQEVVYSDWRASAGAVAFELINLEKLTAKLEGVELAGAGGVDVAGDLTLAAAPLVPWRNVDVTLAFQARRFEVGGVGMAPFAGVLSGGPDRFDVAIPELSCCRDGVLRLADLKAHIAGLLGTEACAIELTCSASAVDYRGLVLTSLQGSGAFQPDAAWFRGTAGLGGQSFNYSCALRRVGDAAGDPEFSGTFELGPLHLSDLVIPAALAGSQGIRITGDLGVDGALRLGAAGQGKVRPRFRLALDRIEWPQRKLTVHGLRGGFRWGPAAETVDAEAITVDAIRLGDYELTSARARLEWMSDQLVRVELIDAQLFEGHVRVPPFVWDVETGNFDPVLILEDVHLARLAKLLPQFTGSIEGYLNGRLPFTVKAGKVRTTGGRLELDRRRLARLQYPADGLLTRGLAPDSDRYRQLKLVEEGLKDLRLEVLTVDLYDPDRPQTPVRVHLEGTFISPRAIVPIVFNLNVNGDLDRALRLLNLGDLQISLD